MLTVRQQGALHMSETETRVYRQAGAEAFASARECRKSGYSPLFRVFTGFASRISSRAAKPAKYENLWVFIRSDVHAVKAGIKLKGQPPLNNPGVFDTLKLFFFVRINESFVKFRLHDAISSLFW